MVTGLSKLVTNRVLSGAADVLGFGAKLVRPKYETGKSRAIWYEAHMNQVGLAAIIKDPAELHVFQRMWPYLDRYLAMSPLFSKIVQDNVLETNKTDPILAAYKLSQMMENLPFVVKNASESGTPQPYIDFVDRLFNADEHQARSDSTIAALYKLATRHQIKPMLSELVKKSAHSPGTFEKEMGSFILREISSEIRSSSLDPLSNPIEIGRQDLTFSIRIYNDRALRHFLEYLDVFINVKTKLEALSFLPDQYLELTDSSHDKLMKSLLKKHNPIVEIQRIDLTGAQTELQGYYKIAILYRGAMGEAKMRMKTASNFVFLSDMDIQKAGAALKEFLAFLKDYIWLTEPLWIVGNFPHDERSGRKLDQEALAAFMRAGFAAEMGSGQIWRIVMPIQTGTIGGSPVNSDFGLLLKNPTN